MYTDCNCSTSKNPKILLNIFAGLSRCISNTKIRYEHSDCGLSCKPVESLTEIMYPFNRNHPNPPCHDGNPNEINHHLTDHHSTEPFNISHPNSSCHDENPNEINHHLINHHSTEPFNVSHSNSPCHDENPNTIHHSKELRFVAEHHPSHDSLLRRNNNRMNNTCDEIQQLTRFYPMIISTNEPNNPENANFLRFNDSHFNRDSTCGNFSEVEIRPTITFSKDIMDQNHLHMRTSHTSPCDATEIPMTEFHCHQTVPLFKRWYMSLLTSMTIVMIMASSIYYMVF